MAERPLLSLVSGPNAVCNLSRRLRPPWRRKRRWRPVGRASLHGASRGSDGLRRTRSGPRGGRPGRRLLQIRIQIRIRARWNQRRPASARWRPSQANCRKPGARRGHSKSRIRRRRRFDGQSSIPDWLASTQISTNGQAGNCKQAKHEFCDASRGECKSGHRYACKNDESLFDKIIEPPKLKRPNRTARKQQGDSSCFSCARQLKLQTKSRLCSVQHQQQAQLIPMLMICFLLCAAAIKLQVNVLGSSSSSPPELALASGGAPNQAARLPAGAVCLPKQRRKPLTPPSLSSSLATLEGKNNSANNSSAGRAQPSRAGAELEQVAGTPGGQDTNLVKPSELADLYDSLIQSSENSIQLRRGRQQQQQQQQDKPGGSSLSGAKRQFAFKTICGGWHNSVTRDAAKPKAYWAFDEERSILVAKFIFYDASEYIDVSREALLTSPKFQPIPAYHSMQESRYYASCKLFYSHYMTIPSHMEVWLTLDPNESELLSKANHKQARYKLDMVHGRTLTEGKQLAERFGESVVWVAREASLPLNLTTNSPYSLEFSATPGPIASGSVHKPNYLHGLAIANISLSPQCFGLEVDQAELERIKRITGLDPIVGASQSRRRDPSGRRNTFVAYFDTYKTEIFVVLIVILILILISSQYVLCAFQRSLQKQKRGSGLLFTQVCCCCGLTSGKSRKRVYVSNNNNKHRAEFEARFGQTEDARNHLRPLKATFENVELNENPTYMLNGNPYEPLLMKSISEPLDPYSIDRKRLTLTKPLGKGAFGEVYQGYLVCYSSGDDDDGRSPRSILEVNAGELENFESHSMKVAVKTLTDERMSQTDFIREAINMSLVRHRNIVEFIGVCFEEKPLYIVMELLQGGNLKNFLLKNRDKVYHSSYSPSPTPPAPIQLSSLASATLNRQQPQQQQHQHQHHQNQPVESSLRPRLCMGDLLVFALDIARACDYLQKNQFIHRDLAARNCLLTAGVKMEPGSPEAPTGAPQLSNAGSPPPSSGRSFVDAPPSALEVNANHKVDLNKVFLNGFMNSSIVAKLADFGMTRDIYSNDYYRMNRKEMPVRWMPPECLDGVATIKSDVWSYGIFLWELFSMGQMPYQSLLDNHQVVEFLKERRHVKPRSAFRSNQSVELLLAMSDENVARAAGRQPDQQELLGVTAAASPTSGQSADLLDTEALEACDSPPLQPPHDNTPHPIYSIMCSCWASNPEERPQFEEIANRLYWCLQMPEVLNTSLPSFYEQHTPSGQFAFGRSESRLASTPSQPRPTNSSHANSNGNNNEINADRGGGATMQQAAAAATVANTTPVSANNTTKVIADYNNNNNSDTCDQNADDVEANTNYDETDNNNSRARLDWWSP